ncbi:unnamed protein product [Ambrosiozyma monospora]|uniref:Unnamed protein product n=1 Tax=Ambrosiozyma monospora TaxID=43982 RepID=A0ACB5T5U7_AMBMO|nr:unnamed protein product [Ambrosiozyma monospora]
MYNPYAQGQNSYGQATQPDPQPAQQQPQSHNKYQPQPFSSSTQFYQSPSQQTSHLQHQQFQSAGVGAGAGFGGQVPNYQNQHQQQQQQPHLQQAGHIPGAGVGAGIGGSIPGAGTGNPNMNFNTFFNDPAAQMGLHFSQSAFNASQQYVQNNFGQYVGNSSDIKYYFKVSNSYVMKKLFLILFPYRNKTWTRQFRTSTEVGANGSAQATEIYATPIEDVNAPDLYIPLMAFMSYIIFWALLSGFEGDFHPQLLGYATSKTFAFYFLDVLLLKTFFYLLSIPSKNSKIWDLVSYSGYKFVSVFVLMMIKYFTNNSYFFSYGGLLVIVFSLGFFMMRSLRYVVLPSGLEAGNLSAGTKRARTQYLFAYSFLIQTVMVWLMA